MEQKVERSIHYVKNYINTIFAIAVASLVFALKPAELVSWQSWIFGIGAILLSALVLSHAWWRQVELMNIAMFSKKRMLILSALRVVLAILFVYSVRSLGGANELTVLSVLPFFAGIALLFLVAIIVQSIMLKPLYGKIRAMQRREILTDWLLLLSTAAAFLLVVYKIGAPVAGFVFYAFIAFAVAARFIAAKATRWKELPPPHRGGRPARDSRDKSRSRNDRSPASRQRSRTQAPREARSQGGRPSARPTTQTKKSTAPQERSSAPAGRPPEQQGRRTAQPGKAGSQNRRTRPPADRSTAQERINQKHRSTSPRQAPAEAEANRQVAPSEANTRPQQTAKAAAPPAPASKSAQPVSDAKTDGKATKKATGTAKPRSQRRKSETTTSAKTTRKPSRSRQPRASKAASAKAAAKDEIMPVPILGDTIEPTDRPKAADVVATKSEAVEARTKALPKPPEPETAQPEESGAAQRVYGRKAIRKGPSQGELDRLFQEALEQDATAAEAKAVDAGSAPVDEMAQEKKKMLYGRKPRRKPSKLRAEGPKDETEDDAGTAKPSGAADVAAEDSGEEKREKS